jgi:hypothetical protein
MERQQVRGPAFQTETVSHACLLIFAHFVSSQALCLFVSLCHLGVHHLGVQAACFHFVDFIGALKTCLKALNSTPMSDFDISLAPPKTDIPN